MFLSLKQAPAATVDLLLERPELAVVFWMNPDYAPPKTPGWVKWLARFLGGYTPPMDIPEPPQELARNGEELWLEKHWVELNDELGLMQLGQPIEGSTHGHGDDRALTPAQVQTLQQSFQAKPDSHNESERFGEFLQTTVDESLGLVIQLS